MFSSPSLSKFGLTLALFFVLTLTACGKDEEKPAEAPTPPAQEGNAAIPTSPVGPAVIQTLKPAKMVVRPSSIRMGPLLPGSSETKTITIANEGEEVLTINEVRLDADPTELNAAGSCLQSSASSAKVLGRGESCDINLIFVPIQAGGEIQGEVVITPEGDNPPAFIPVVAVKAMQPVAPPAPPPTVYAPSPALENAVSMYRQRRGGQMMVIDSEIDPQADPNNIITKDQDYTPIGFTPTISTLPVDRSRLVTADKYIPAVLENTINSQLPGGRIVGVVENHVYGGDGRFVLIPAGSRAIGVYESLSRQGDTRLKASFVRVMRPDGAAIAIEGDPAADPMGRLGLIGDVDNRYFDRFAGPLLISLINAVGTYATAPETIISSDGAGNVTTSQTLSAEEQAYQNFATDLSYISQRLVEENLNLAPIITIPGGTRFYIMPTRDIMLQGFNLVGVPGAVPQPGNQQVATAVPPPVPQQQQPIGAQPNPSPRTVPAPPTPNRGAQPGYAP
ncbi:MAG: TrbI/VirB10 family protein [Alphaproteobacteria bacterium]|nr:MAG: TrbI/VirB10 family protein [Alphaproteobacteria bacterium]